MYYHFSVWFDKKNRDSKDPTCTLGHTGKIRNELGVEIRFMGNTHILPYKEPEPDKKRVYFTFPTPLQWYVRVSMYFLQTVTY